MAVPKPMLTEFGTHYRLKSCGHYPMCFIMKTRHVFINKQLTTKAFLDIAKLLLHMKSELYHIAYCFCHDTEAKNGMTKKALSYSRSICYVDDLVYQSEK